MDKNSVEKNKESLVIKFRRKKTKSIKENVMMIGKNRKIKDSE
jgi:hypothetical protein